MTLVSSPTEMSSTTATILRNSKSSQRKRYDHAISLIYQPCCSVRFGRTTVVVVTFSQNCATSLMRCCSLARSQKKKLKVQYKAKQAASSGGETGVKIKIAKGPAAATAAAASAAGGKESAPSLGN